MWISMCFSVWLPSEPPVLIADCDLPLQKTHTHKSACSLLMWNLTCHLHMLILAAPRDPLTFKKSLEEWKGQAHPHSRMSSQLSHISGMNTDTYTDRPVSYPRAPVNWHMAAWKPGNPPNWGGILPPQLVLLVGVEASLWLTNYLDKVRLGDRGGRIPRPPLITWLLRGLLQEPGPVVCSVLPPTSA